MKCLILPENTMEFILFVIFKENGPRNNIFVEKEEQMSFA